MDEQPPFEFKYSSKDFILQTAPWEDTGAPQQSKFDDELCGRWDDNMRRGVFRYSMDHILTRIIPGPKQYVAQLNDKRATERRKPQAILSVNQPFNPDIFNFTKIPNKEILFSLSNTDDEIECIASETTNLNGKSEKKEGERHIVIVNVSPLEYGHVLLVPQVDQGKPQVLTETSIKVGIEMILLSRHRGFKLGFNSLCAYASVNHQHMHCYYLEHPLIVEHCDVESLGYGVSELTIMPCNGFAFQLHGHSVQQISRLISEITQYFQQQDIAHNLFVTRGTVFGEDKTSKNRTIRLFLFPRQKFIGTKVADVPEFNVAVIELAGHLPIKDENSYHNITEQIADDIISQVNLPVEEYKEIKCRVLDIAKQLAI